MSGRRNYMVESDADRRIRLRREALLARDRFQSQSYQGATGVVTPPAVSPWQQLLALHPKVMLEWINDRFTGATRK